MRKLLLLTCLATPLVAWADDPAYELVGYQCDVSNHRLVVAFKEVKGVDDGRHTRGGWVMWNVGDLVSMKDDDHIGKLRTVRGACKLGRTSYALQLGPAPQNMNIQGRCGAADLAAWVKVMRNGKLILPRTELGSLCPSPGKATTRIVFAPDVDAPELTTVEDSESP